MRRKPRLESLFIHDSPDLIIYSRGEYIILDVGHALLSLTDSTCLFVLTQAFLKSLQMFLFEQNVFRSFTLNIYRKRKFCGYSFLRYLYIVMHISLVNLLA